jgi:hypothetical protein
MKQAVYLLIFIAVLSACNEKRKEQKTEAKDICQQGINSELLRKINWIKEDSNREEAKLFYIVRLSQRNDSNFVSVTLSLNPPVSSISPVPPFLPIRNNDSWIGFINKNKDCYVFFGRVSDDFLATIVQHDALNTCREDLELLEDPEAPGLSGYTYTFFIDEYGCFILKQKEHR